MKKKIHCGRLVRNRDGTVKKLQLSDGGGTRDCIWDHIDMTFDEIQENLCKLFQIDTGKDHPQLFDFCQRPLDKTKFSTFFEYVSVNGLKFNATLLYLCTSSDNERNTMTIDRQAESSSSTQVKRTAQAEADSSTTSSFVKNDRYSPELGEPIVDRSLVTSRPIDRTEKRQRSPSNSYSDYSFDRSLNELIQHLRRILVENRRETIFVQLFEEFSTLNGLSSLVLDRLKREVDKKLKTDSNTIYIDAFDKIERLVRTIKTTIELNKFKIDRIDGTSILINSFEQFAKHFNALQDRWNGSSEFGHDRQRFSSEPVHNDRNYSSESGSNRRNISSESNNHRRHNSVEVGHNHRNLSSDSVHERQNNSVESGHDRWNNSVDVGLNHRNHSAGSSHDRWNNSVDIDRNPRNLSAEYGHANLNNSVKTSHDSGKPRASESRRASPKVSRSNSRKTSESSRNDEHRRGSISRPSSSGFTQRGSMSRPSSSGFTGRGSISRPTSTGFTRRGNPKPGTDHVEEFSFQNFFWTIGKLGSYTKDHHLKEFAKIVDGIISDVKFTRTRFNKHSEKSLNITKQLFFSIEHRLQDKVNHLNQLLSPERINPDLERLVNDSLASSREARQRIDRIGSKTQRSETNGNKRWSTPPPPLSSSGIDVKLEETKTNIRMTPIKTAFNEDQSSDASNSSIGDEVLLEVAKKSYERRIRENK